VKNSGLPELPGEKPYEILATFGISVAHELLKLAAAATGDAGLTAAIDSGGGVIKATHEYRKARQDQHPRGMEWE
jgi:hypothetical protein